MRTKELPMIFGYGGADAEYVLEGQSMHINFTGRWECNDAWDFIDGLLSDLNYSYREDLVMSRIDGVGKEDGARYHEGVRKMPGEIVLRRKRK
jgi:hypothetical protein